MARPDFSLIWGSSRPSIPAISSGNYAAGWDAYLGPLPPLADDHDYVMNLQDKRANWLGGQMLKAVGHEWQSDITYNAEAYTRSTVDGKLYKSLLASNLGNEPSASPASWRVLPDLSTPVTQASINGSFRNLKASATGTSHPVTITADEVVVKNGSGLAQLLSAVNLSVSAAVSGANGLDTGTSAASTWYAIFVIWNGTTTAGLLSLSATAPTLPSGYTHFARVGWMRTDSTGNKYPLGFVQSGRTVQYRVASGSNVTSVPVMASGVLGSPTVPSWSAVSVSSFVPTTAGAIDVIFGGTFGTSGAAIAAPNNSYGPDGSTTNPSPFARSAAQAEFDVRKGRMILESTSVYYASNTGGTSLRCAGWEDNL